MMLDFEIPSDLDDLVNSEQDEDKFKVQRVYKGSEIAQKLDGKQFVLEDANGIYKQQY